MSAPVSTHQIQNYTVLQPTSHILTTALSGVAHDQTTTINTTPVVQACTPSADIHICGACNTQFTDLKAFVNHKEQGCQSTVTEPAPAHTYQTNVVSTQAESNTTATSLLSPTILPVGMPVGVILQSPSGQTQMYRYVMMDSNMNAANGITTTTPSIQLSQPNNGNESISLQIPSEGILGENRKTPIKVEIPSSNQISRQPPERNEDNLIQISAINDDWSENDRPPEDLPSNTNIVQSGMTSIHKEGEVATFLATQLGSQNVITNTSTDNQVITSSNSLNFQTSPFIGTGIEAHTTIQEFDKQHIIDLNEDRKVKYTKETNKKHSNEDALSKAKSKMKTCSYEGCFYTTIYSKCMERHTRIHTGEKPYLCKICNKRFTRGDKLKIHMRIHSNEKPYACKEPGCTYQVVDIGSLKKHMRVHRDERPYKCQLCPYRSRDSSQLTVHLRSHTGDAPFQCMAEGCSSAFKTSSDLKRHERLHTGVKPYVCTICKYACAVKSNLTIHMKSKHFEGAKFACCKCNFIGSSRKQLREHEKSHSDVLFECNVCDYTSTTNHGLSQHMVVHIQDRPFKCRYCVYTSRTKRHLNQHLVNKHGCDISNKKQTGPSTSASTYVEEYEEPKTGHIRPRSNSMKRISRPSCYQRFKCEECGSGFVLKESYRSHMRQHENHRKKLENDAIEESQRNNSVYNMIVKGENITHEIREPRGTSVSKISNRKKELQQSSSAISLSNNVTSDTFQVATNSENVLGGNCNTTDSYNYVITIEGVSSVFSSNRIQTPLVTMDSTGMESSVEVIPSNLATMDSDKNVNNGNNYERNSDDK